MDQIGTSSGARKPRGGMPLLHEKVARKQFSLIVKRGEMPNRLGNRRRLSCSPVHLPIQVSLPTVSPSHLCFLFFLGGWCLKSSPSRTKGLKNWENDLGATSISEKGERAARLEEKFRPTTPQGTD